MKTMLLAGLATLSLHGVAMAQGQGAQGQGAMPAPQRVEGTVSAVSDTSLTLAKSDGTSATVALLPNRTVTLTEPIAVDQIKPGSYVATANKSQPDGSGVSIELRVYPPDTPRFDINRAMDAGGETMMTNGRVATAISSDGGRMLTVDYGSGSRKITVPAGLGVVSNTPGNPAMVRVGLKVAIATFTFPGEPAARQTITIAKKDLAAQ